MQVVITRESKRFGILRLQYDQYGMSRPTQNGQAVSKLGLPDTVKGIQETGVRDWVYLTEAMQKWMHRLCWERTPSMSEDEAKLSWRSMMNGGGGADGNQMSARAFSDYAGSETNADYINGKNLDKEPIKLKTILTGGAFVEILDMDAKKVKIRAIDPNSDFTRFHPRTHPHLFFYPTISRREPVKDPKTGKTVDFIEWYSIPFPQYNDLSVLPIWAQPGDDYVYMPADRVEITTAPKNPFKAAYPYPNPYR